MAKPEKQVAVLSTDGNPIFSLLAPVTSYLWRELIGYQAFVYIVGNVPAWIVDKILETGAAIQPVAQIAGVPSWRLAQNVRLFAGREERFADEVYLLMT